MELAIDFIVVLTVIGVWLYVDHILITDLRESNKLLREQNSALMQTINEMNELTKENHHVQ